VGGGTARLLVVPLLAILQSAPFRPVFPRLLLRIKIKGWYENAEDITDAGTRICTSGSLPLPACLMGWQLVRFPCLFYCAPSLDLNISGRYAAYCTGITLPP
jgi:hypothetical protein